MLIESLFDAAKITTLNGYDYCTILRSLYQMIKIDIYVFVKRGFFLSFFYWHFNKKVRKKLFAENILVLPRC